MSTTTTTEIAPAAYAVKQGKVYIIGKGPRNGIKGSYRQSDAQRFADLEIAREVAAGLLKHGFKGTRVVRLPAITDTQITEAGRAAVMAARAARRAS